jgi:hypothetical protein
MVGILIVILGILFFVVASFFFSDVAPVLTGQRWHLQGVGPVVISNVLGFDGEFDGVGKGLNVQYRTAHGSYGYCTKGDVRNTGVLLPYDKIDAERVTQDLSKQLEIEKLLETMRLKKIELSQEWKPYKPPTRQRVYNDVTVLTGVDYPPDEQKKTVMEAEVIYPKQFQPLYNKKK